MYKATLYVFIAIIYPYMRDAFMKSIFSFFVYDNTMSELKVHECGRENCRKKKNPIRTVRTCYILHYLVAGKGIFIVNGKTHHLKAGDMFLIPPKAQNTYYPDENEPWSYYWVGLEGTKARTVIKEAGFDEQDNLVKSVGISPSLVKNFRQCSFSYNDRGYLHYTTLGYLYHILAELCEMNSSRTNAIKTVPDQYVSKAIDYIHTNYAERITVASIAAHLGLNANYFSGIFSRTMGISPKQYIINYRINIACKLLADRSHTVGEVGQMVGYTDSLHFSREFKNVKGISPKHFVMRPFTTTE